MTMTTAAGATRATLRRKIGWISQGVRLAAVAYPLWVLYLMATYWSDRSRIVAGYGRWIERDLSDMAAWQQAAAFGVNFAPWLFTAYACYCAWRLFSAYLAGEVLTPVAAVWLRRVALAGVTAQILGVAERPLISTLLTLRLPPEQRVVSFTMQPTDLAFLMLLFALLAIAHIQKSAADIAAEHAEFV